MIRAAMIDVDGVLVLGRPVDGQGWATDLETDLGLSADDLVREFFQPHWDDVVTGRDDLLARLAPALLRIAPHVSSRDLIDYWFARDSRLDVSLLREVSALRRSGVEVHLATNQEHLRARHIMENMRLADHVDGMFYSADLGCRKPDRSFFGAIRARMHLRPEQLLLIDDTATNVAAARAMGWRALRWEPGMSLRNELASFGVDYPSTA